MSRLFVMVIVVSACAAARADDSFTVPKNAASVLHQRCIDCHDGESAEGNVRFDTLPKLSNDERLELLNKAQEQLYFGLMPPEDAEQPSDAERELLADWVSGELKRFGASKLEEKLQKQYGDKEAYASDPRFKSGVVFLVAGLVALIIFNGILGWLGGLAMVAGVVLILIAILDM